MKGRLLGIARRDKKRSPMDVIEWADVTLDSGVAADFRGKPGQRQVTVLSRDAWAQACHDVGAELDWSTRRANLLVEGLVLDDTAGGVIRIGDLQLLITGETDPCQRMEDAQPGLRQVMEKAWRGGVCCRVIRPGRIQIGDDVELIT